MNGQPSGRAERRVLGRSESGVTRNLTMGESGADNRVAMQRSLDNISPARRQQQTTVERINAEKCFDVK